MEGISIKSGWLAFIFSAFFCLNQGTLHGQSKVSELDGKTHLKMLINGILLVRLQDMAKKTKLMEDAGLHKRLAKDKKENDERNQVIIDGFKKYFNYTEIYFFYSSSTDEILNKRYSGHLFYDKEGRELEIDTTKAIYVCDFGYASPAGETYRYNYEGFLIRHINNKKIERIAKTDIFYRGAPYGLLSGSWKKRKIKKAIIDLNQQLTKGGKYYRSKKFNPADYKEENLTKPQLIKIQPYTFPKN